MYNDLIVSHVNKPRYVDISQYTIYRNGLALYRYSDIVLKRYDTIHDILIYCCISNNQVQKCFQYDLKRFQKVVMKLKNNLVEFSTA